MPLVGEKEALRMSFIKLEPTSKVGNNYVKDMLKSKGTLPFLIRTTAYVDGCDITTEHNLSLTFQDSIPYPVPNYKETLTLLPTPNPATNGKCIVKATLNKRLDSSNELYYYLVETDGKTKAWETTNPNLQGEFYIIVNWSEFILKNKAVLLEFAEKHWGTFNLQLIQTDHSFVMEWLSELDKYLGNDIINQGFYRSAWELAQKME